MLRLIQQARTAFIIGRNYRETFDGFMITSLLRAPAHVRFAHDVGRYGLLTHLCVTLILEPFDSLIESIQRRLQ